MSYIAFLDLLGTRGACDEQGVYYDNIKNFTRAVKALSVIIGNTGSVGIFSDSVYVESSRIDSILDFLIELRFLLIGDNLFFNAALQSGKLGVKDIMADERKNHEEIPDNLFGAKFTSPQITEIYCKQNAFRGAGIWIDPKLKKDIEQTGKYKVINSLYMKKTENNNIISYIPISYYDVPLFNQQEDSFTKKRKQHTLAIISKVLYSSHMKSSRYSAYYISLLINIIRCLDLSEVKWNNNSEIFENAPIDFKLIYNLLVQCNSEMDDLVGLDCLCFALLDVIYNSSSFTDVDKLNITRKKFINIFDCIKEKYVRYLDSVPQEPFTGKNRSLFIKLCNTDMAGQFVKKILN